MYAYLFHGALPSPSDTCLCVLSYSRPSSLVSYSMFSNYVFLVICTFMQ